MFRKFLFLVLSISVLSGCSARPHYRVVTQIEVTSDTQHYRYVTPSKLEKFLYYLRSLETWGPAELDQLEGTQYHITVTYSDGSTKRYRQRNSRCLSVNDGGWMKIRSEKGEKLFLLLEAVPSDP